MNHRLKVYFIAVGWFMLHSFSSVSNDIISKYTGLRLPSFEVAFFRFLFSTVTLVPFIGYYGLQTLKTSNLPVHLARGTLLFLGMTSWTCGLTIVPVTTATVIGFAIPLFTLILAVFLLNENIIWQRWLVTLIAFIGVVVTLSPAAADFNPQVLIFILAALSFATLDVINKKFIVKESMISMLFYSALVTTALATPCTIFYWQMPTSTELLLFLILGASANLILFFILKAFALIDATALAPYRYLELIISAITSYLIFNELPRSQTIYGALIIIPATLFIVYSEKASIINKTNNLAKIQP